MSDRLAVFNVGRVEQVGSPAEVYERPATAFVMGFIGVSNVLDGEPAARITREPGRLHRSAGEDRACADGGRCERSQCTATGIVREVVYLGAVTRYIVQLDRGGELVVMQQNLTTSSMEALQVRGSRCGFCRGTKQQPARGRCR